MGAVSAKGVEFHLPVGIYPYPGGPLASDEGGRIAALRGGIGFPDGSQFSAVPLLSGGIATPSRHHRRGVAWIDRDVGRPLQRLSFSPCRIRHLYPAAGATSV